MLQIHRTSTTGNGLVTKSIAVSTMTDTANSHDEVADIADPQLLVPNERTQGDRFSFNMVDAVVLVVVLLLLLWMLRKDKPVTTIVVQFHKLQGARVTRDYRLQRSRVWFSKQKDGQTLLFLRRHDQVV